MPWPEVWAWLGGRLTVVGRGLALFGIALSGLVMLAALAGVIGFLPALDGCIRSVSIMEAW